MERRTQATSLHGQSNHLQQSWNPMYSRQQPQSYDANNDLNLEKLTCNICGYIAKSVSLLQIHFRKHTGEKPFHCPHCNYRSAQNNNLKSHIKRVHQPPEFNSNLSTNLNNSMNTKSYSNDSVDQSTRLINSCTTKSYSNATEGKVVPTTQALFNNPSSNIASTTTSLPTISEGSMNTSASGTRTYQSQWSPEEMQTFTVDPGAQQNQSFERGENFY